MSEMPTVFVIDDDEDVRSSLEWLLGKAGLRVETHGSARSKSLIVAAVLRPRGLKKRFCPSSNCEIP